MQNESVSLSFTEGSSDKVYFAQLEAKDAGYVVNFSYGRRGSTLTSGTKTASPVPYEKAKKVFDALVRDKRAKGYTDGEAGTPFSGSELAGRVSGLQVQLSNAITEAEAESLINSADWVAQEKHDGERRPVRFGTDQPIGVNKKGLIVALPTSVVSALEQLNMDAGRTTLDAELIGEVLHVFDVIELYDADLREQPLGARLDILEGLPFNTAIRLVPTARSTAEKRALFDRVRRDNGEGVVFKRLGTVYSAGKPASGGDVRKFKFTADATVRVKGANEGKRSVVMELQDDAGIWIEVGSVTIPPSVPVPVSGALIDVQYLYAFPTPGSLFQPTFKAVRSDQSEGDCQVSQLKFKPTAEAA
jgi:bifunctional non-homologous end joining protein LigD